MENRAWAEHTVKRASYRAVLRADASEETIQQSFTECQSAMEDMRERNSLLTASLYRYEKFLFLYTEGVDKGIDPDELFAPLNPMLQIWPAVLEEPDANRRWIFMQPYYYHAVPQNVQEWMENRKPSLRRGRIALLAPGKWEEYMEYHFLLMREGVIEGDRYHMISIHENVLFSYFEEPKTMTSLLDDSCRVAGRNVESFDLGGANMDRKSKVLEEWLRTEPESHFARFARGQGLGPDHNFVFLPYCVGV